MMDDWGFRTRPLVCETIDAHTPIEAPDARPDPAAEAVQKVALTARRLAVLRLAAEGRSVQETARALGIGMGTVSAHWGAILAALGDGLGQRVLTEGGRDGRDDRRRD